MQDGTALVPADGFTRTLLAPTSLRLFVHSKKTPLTIGMPVTNVAVTR